MMVATMMVMTMTMRRRRRRRIAKYLRETRYIPSFFLFFGFAATAQEVRWDTRADKWKVQ
jgi:hypothetical protein